MCKSLLFNFHKNNIVGCQTNSKSSNRTFGTCNIYRQVYHKMIITKIYYNFVGVYHQSPAGWNWIFWLTLCIFSPTSGWRMCLRVPSITNRLMVLVLFISILVESYFVERRAPVAPILNTVEVEWNKNVGRCDLVQHILWFYRVSFCFAEKSFPSCGSCCDACG